MADARGSWAVSPDMDECQEVARRITDTARWRLVVLSAEDCATMLGKSTPGTNRKINTRRVQMMADDMRLGRWVANIVDAVCTDECGNVLNGQHRLNACVMSGVPYVGMLIEGITRELYDKLDQAWVRTWVQRHANDVANTQDTSATITLLLRYAETEPGSPLCHTGTVYSSSMMDDMLVCNTPLLQSVSYVGRARELVGAMYPCQLIMTHFLGSKTSPDKADEFIARAKDGAMLADDSPIRALRNILMGRSKLVDNSRDHRLALIVKAWRAFEEGKSVKLLRVDKSAGFPRFKTNWPDPD